MSIYKRSLSILIVILSLHSCSSDESSSSAEENLVFEIGQEHEGGIIFYIDDTGEHGLIAAREDLQGTDSTGDATWGCIFSDFPTAQNEDIGAGAENTVAIVNNCEEILTAGKLCADLTLNGQDDWFLPSIRSLELMYEQRDLIGNFDVEGSSGFAVYMSSTESVPSENGNNGDVRYINYLVYNFADVLPPSLSERELNTNKTNALGIRPVRSF